MTTTTHDDRCEQGPRGAYNGMTIGTSGDPIPCHCPARAQGAAEARFDLAQQAGQVSATARAAEFATAPEEPQPVLVRLNLQGNLAFAAADVPGSGMTLGELLGDLQDAIDRYGEDAVVVTMQTNNERGAQWGRISYNPFDAADAAPEFL